LPAATKIDMFALEDPAPIILALNSNFFVALLASGVVAASLAFILSIPVFRVRGDYLAIVTLGFGFIIRIVAMNSPSYTNGAMGLNDIPGNANLYWTGFIAIFLICSGVISSSVLIVSVDHINSISSSKSKSSCSFTNLTYSSYDNQSSSSNSSSRVTSSSSHSNSSSDKIRKFPGYSFH